jgi:hypothetical protein
MATFVTLFEQSIQIRLRALRQSLLKSDRTSGSAERIDRELGEVDAALTSDGKEWLPGLATSAQEGGERRLAEVGFGNAVRVGRTGQLFLHGRDPALGLDGVVVGGQVPLRPAPSTLPPKTAQDLLPVSLKGPPP